MSEAKSLYVGWLVDPADREHLLARFPPRYAEPVAHHVTLKFADRQVGRPPDAQGEIIGEADDGQGVQAMVVKVNGTTERPDGGVFHITWSLGPGRKARESNEVINAGWTPFPEAVPVRLWPKGPN